MLRPERYNLLEDALSHPLTLCGKPLVADSSGAMYWPAEKTLLVTDLHLEKGSAYAARGTMLPPYDTRETLTRLAAVLDRYEPDRVIALGDSFHDDRAAERISKTDLEILRMLQEDREWIWLTGNHDARIADVFGGRVCSELKIGGIRLRHQPSPGCVTHEIAGHMHPAARISMHGYVIRRPCFVANGRRLVMPAFGAFAGGLNVRDAAFADLFGTLAFTAHMLGDSRLYAFTAKRCLPD